MFTENTTEYFENTILIKTDSQSNFEMKLHFRQYRIAIFRARY